MRTFSHASKRWLALAVLAAVPGSLMLGCSSTTEADAASSGDTTISSLPKATAAVTGSSASALKVGAFAAATGIKLKDVDDTATWSGGSKSRAMCELSTMTREILREAASTDRTLCYVGKMAQLNKFTGDLADGNYKYYTLVMGGAPMMRVKFKIVKDSTTGRVTNYEMFSCNSNDGSTFTHQEYVTQTLTSTSASILSKYVGSQSQSGMTFTFGSETSVTGDIDSTGAWNSKEINASRTFGYTDGGSQTGSFSQKLTLTQGPTSMIINGFNSNSFYNSGKQGGAGTSTGSVRMYGKVQLLNASAMQTIAFGDGSAKAIMDFDGQDVSGAGAGVAATAHWNGDTAGNEGTSDHAAAVASGTPRSIEAVSVSFGAGQTWDCESADLTSVDVSESDMVQIQTCDEIYDFGTGEQGGANACYQMP